MIINHAINPFFWVNLITSSLRANPGNHSYCSKGNHPQMAARFRLVNYYNLPRYMEFPNRKSTIWGIYSEYCLFFEDPLSKSKKDNPWMNNPSINGWIMVDYWVDHHHFPAGFPPCRATVTCRRALQRPCRRRWTASCGSAACCRATWATRNVSDGCGNAWSRCWIRRRTLGKCWENVGKMLGKCGENVGKMWG